VLYFHRFCPNKKDNPPK